MKQVTNMSRLVNQLEKMFRGVYQGTKAYYE